jgi:predicted esterase
MINFLINTPPGYEENDKQFPVLYFLHGRGGNHLLYWAAISQSIPEAEEMVFGAKITIK